jgi:hypothetical protein
MRRVLRGLAWTFVVVCTLAPFVVPRRAPRGTPNSLVARLLGPFAELLASAQLVRVDLAIRAGRVDLALARAEAAFELAPGATENWIFVSSYLLTERASPAREANAEQRRIWVRAALVIAERGERCAFDPGELALWQGLVLIRTADVDPQLPWSDGVRGMWNDAALCFERAAGYGTRAAVGLAEQARAQAAAIEGD